MGIAVTLILVFVMAFIAFAGRPMLGVYALLFLIVFFAELGTNFTSFNGSFVFNQDFVNLMKFKLIEIVILVVYPIALFRHPGPSGGVMRFEKWLLFAMMVLIISLLFYEYFANHTITVSDWRHLIAGVMILLFFARVIDSEERLKQYVTVLVIFLGIRAFIGLAMYFAGYGVSSPRGMAPFFWDSHQVSAFGLGTLLTLAYLTNYRGFDMQERRLPGWLAAALFVVLIITVTLSLRRTIWFSTFGGIALVLMTSPRLRMQHHLVILFAVAMGMVVLMTAPPLEKFRDRMSSYVSSMNLFSTEVAEEHANDVHIDNVRQHSLIIAENPKIMLVGVRAVGDYGDLVKRYSSDTYILGVAHNAILRITENYGLFGLLIYFLLYFGAFFQVRKVLKIPPESPLRYIAICSLIYLFMEFLPSLFFVPPFNTSIKGLFYTLTALLMLRSALYFADTRESPETAPAAGVPASHRPHNLLA